MFLGKNFSLFVDSCNFQCNVVVVPTDPRLIMHSGINAFSYLVLTYGYNAFLVVSTYPFPRLSSAVAVLHNPGNALIEVTVVVSTILDVQCPCSCISPISICTCSSILSSSSVLQNCQNCYAAVSSPPRRRNNHPVSSPPRRGNNHPSIILISAGKYSK
jgi:hypothetical protein